MKRRFFVFHSRTTLYTMVKMPETENVDDTITQEEKTKRRGKERDSNYISPKQFSAELAEYYRLAELVEELDENDDSKEARKLRRQCKKALDVCGVGLYKIANGLAKNTRFSGYTWIDEMVCDALSKRNRALVGRKYDFSKGFNPFSYFNRIFWREFIRRIKIENKNTETKNKYIAEHYKDFAQDSETAIYVRKLFMEDFGEFWDQDEYEQSMNLSEEP